MAAAAAAAAAIPPSSFIVLLLLLLLLLFPLPLFPPDVDDKDDGSPWPAPPPPIELPFVPPPPAPELPPEWPMKAAKSSELFDSDCAFIST
uniref:Putative secreted peptide n=1 Tax=Anopheles braziliensis TaxID=58242 RepID=A0A2M3ZWE6_9DIPT